MAQNLNIVFEILGKADLLKFDEGIEDGTQAEVQDTDAETSS